MDCSTAENNATLRDFCTVSAEIVAAHAVGNAISTFFSLVTFACSSLQMAPMLLWKPLRQKRHVLLVGVALSDALKSVTFGIVAAKRVWLASLGKDDVTDQLTCMQWLFGMHFSIGFSMNIVLALSMERMLAIAAPLWYRCKKTMAQAVMLTMSIGIALLCTGASLVKAEKTKIQLTCTSVTSSNPNFYHVAIWYQYVCIGGICGTSVITAALMLRRWRAARVARANMKRFKKDVDLQALKLVFALVGVCLISFFAAASVMLIIEKMDSVQKAYYGPFIGCLGLLRGLCDFGVYVALHKQFRKGLCVMMRRKV